MVSILEIAAHLAMRLGYKTVDIPMSMLLHRGFDLSRDGKLTANERRCGTVMSSANPSPLAADVICERSLIYSAKYKQ